MRRWTWRMIRKCSGEALRRPLRMSWSIAKARSSRQGVSCCLRELLAEAGILDSLAEPDTGIA